MLCSTFMNSARASVALFESFTSCEKPEGWVVQNDFDAGWYFNEDFWSNTTGGYGCYAFAESNTQQNMDTALVTPSVNCQETKCEVLSFRHDTYANDPDTEFFIEISTDEGLHWSEIWRKQHLGDTSDSYQAESIDIKALSEAQVTVQFRFHYIASNDWWWQVDDVKVASKSNWLLFMPAIIARPTP